MDYDEIVIGSSLGALMYAFGSGVPIFFTLPQRPHEFEYFDKPLTIPLLNITPDESTFKTPTQLITKGQKKCLLWDKLYFTLSLAGLCPTSDLAQSLRIKDCELKIFNEYSKIATVNFQKAIIFDNERLNLQTKNEPQDYIVFDWVSVHSGGRHDFDLIQTDDKFVQEIWFYESNRVPSKIKDICIISYLNKQQLDDFNYSDTYARFKTEKIMKSYDMKGASNGIDKKTGKNKYYGIKTSCLNRNYTKLGMPAFMTHDAIAVNKLDELTLLDSLNSPPDNISDIVRKLCT
tara:strand:+ start:17307 stop:18176 length:870 start_codon:yes stop_codon:yes gene_type:complete